MSGIDIDLLRREECQPLTQEQMADIKSQFHPSNTANVNITPYHIYDEDEHVVGEWRKTIDGVKKKKPVYEKIVIGTSPATSGEIVTGITNVDFAGLVSCYIDGIGGYTMNIAYYGENFIDIKSDASTIWFQYSNGSGYASRPFRAIIQYTKTTDTWENVI